MPISPVNTTHQREASSFLELSPGGPSSPTPSSSSSSLSSSSTGALSPTLSDFALPPTDPWRTAFAEAAAGIYYTTQAVPQPGAVIPPALAGEMLTLGANVRIVLLEDLDRVRDPGRGSYLNHIRVRVLDTGETGVTPAWNAEDAIERLARLNTDFNEAATCPVERKSASRKSQGTPEWSTPAEYEEPSYAHLYAPLAHQHDRCRPFSPRTFRKMSRPAPSDEDDDDEAVDPFGLAEENDGALTVRRKDDVRRKSVGFAEVDPTVFRYPSAALVEAYYGEAGEEQSQEDEENWWSAGWQERKGDDDESFMDCESAPAWWPGAAEKRNTRRYSIP